MSQQQDDEAANRIPWWAVNVPADQRPSTCPDFLLDADERDQKMLATPDCEYRRLTWPEVTDIVGTNRIDLFGRVPSDLRRYREYTAKLKKDYGSVMAFIMKERLQWADLVARGKPFEYQEDVKILYNDWPYGIDTRIVHLVVWVKFALEEDSVTGDLSKSARAQIDDYVSSTFRPHAPEGHVVWFRNWSALKSIHAVEHFHVMLFDPDERFVKDITNGDVPLIDKVKAA